MNKSSKTVYEGKALTLKLEQVAYPDGSRGSLEIIRHPGGAATVALNERGEVCLIRQYRYATNGWLWEIPAGRIDYNEDPFETAQRELGEEAGIIANQWDTLTTIFPSPGICDERIYLYMATDLTPISTSHEEDEHIEIHWIPFAEAIKWIQQGEIIDAKTIIALFCAQYTISAN